MNNLIFTTLSPQELKQFLREVFVEFQPKVSTYSAPLHKSNDIEFDITGLAKYLKCSVQTIHNLKKDGSIPFYRLGRKVYFKKSEIDQIARVDKFLEKILA